MLSLILSLALLLDRSLARSSAEKVKLKILTIALSGNWPSGPKRSAINVSIPSTFAAISKTLTGTSRMLAVMLRRALLGSMLSGL